MVRYYGTHSDLGTGRLTITRNSLSLEEKGLFREQIAGTIMLMQLHNGHHLNPQSIPPVFEEGSIIPPITRATEMIIYLAGGVSKPASTQESRQAITLYYRKPNRLAQKPRIYFPETINIKQDVPSGTLDPHFFVAVSLVSPMLCPM